MTNKEIAIKDTVFAEGSIVTKSVEMTLEQLKDDFNWKNIYFFLLLENLTGGVDQAGNPTTRQVRAFQFDDIAQIVALSNGDNDGPSWLGLFETHDNCYLYVEAGCDYTGWDCQANASAEWHTDLEQAKAMIPQENRKRLLGY